MTALLFMVGFAAPFLLFALACFISEIVHRIVSWRRKADDRIAP